jgi:hypothetical protein
MKIINVANDLPTSLYPCTAPIFGASLGWFELYGTGNDQQCPLSQGEGEPPLIPMECELPNSPRADCDHDLQKPGLASSQTGGIGTAGQFHDRVNNQSRAWNSNFLPAMFRGKNEIEMDSGTFSIADFSDNWTRNWTRIPTRTNCPMDNPLSHIVHFD